MNSTSGRTDAFIVVAVADPVLHPEAAHAAAATTRPVVDFTDPSQGAELRRYAARSVAVLVDAEFAGELVELRHRSTVFFVTSDRTPMDWEAALRCHAEEAFILPAQSAELLTRLAGLSNPRQAPEHSHTAATRVAVTATAGGSGASTFAAALARVGARSGHAPVTLIDADPHSGGLDLLLGIEETAGGRWPNLAFKEGSEGVVAARDLRAALPATADGIAVLSAARATIDDPFTLNSAQVSQVVSALATAPGLIVVDQPIGTELAPCDLVAVLVPTEVRAAAAGARLIHRLRATKTQHVVLTRRRSWSGLDASELARILGTEAIAELPTVGALAKHGEISGLPTRVPGALRSAAEAVLTEAGLGAA